MRAKSRATLTIQPFATLPKSTQRALSVEAERLVRFLEPDETSFDVVFTRPKVSAP